jgi:eukaryotic-like serine/threonine-protein kinase
VNPEAPGAIAHYNLLERIGQGGLGEVYRARDMKVGRTVALKLAPDSAFADAAAREMFLEDARAAATLSHPNIATLFDVGEYDGGCYLAYEFASGVTLRQEMSGRPENPRRAVELAVQIADALADAHSGGVLHGDLRPDTIFVTQKGSAKVLDFGMSRWTRGGKTRARAASSPESLGADAVRVVGYMSPEQALGGSVDPRSDVFSLGVVLYEMLTGQNPFSAPSAAQTVVNVTSAPVPSSHAAVTASADLDAIVGRAMAKEIDKRHQSAAAFSAELRSVGAILDVRSGDSVPDDYLLPLDDEGGSGRWWWAAAAIAVAAAVIWWFVR